MKLHRISFQTPYSVSVGNFFEVRFHLIKRCDAICTTMFKFILPFVRSDLEDVNDDNTDNEIEDVVDEPVNDEDSERPLKLSQVEAFFLAFALGCLLVEVESEQKSDKEKAANLNIDELWDLFCAQNEGLY